jgi:hypothetical protein
LDQEELESGDMEMRGGETDLQFCALQWRAEDGGGCFSAADGGRRRGLLDRGGCCSVADRSVAARGAQVRRSKTIERGLVGVVALLIEGLGYSRIVGVSLRYPIYFLLKKMENRWIHMGYVSLSIRTYPRIWTYPTPDR